MDLEIAQGTKILRKVVQIARRYNRCPGPKTVKEGLAGKHEVVLNLFCDDNNHSISSSACFLQVRAGPAPRESK